MVGFSAFRATVNMSLKLVILTVAASAAITTPAGSVELISP
jgi:hypothetical protein